MERKRRRLEEEEARKGTERALTAYGAPLSQVTSFKYLERFLATENDDWTEVVPNLRRSRHKWVRPTWLLSREGANARTLGHIYLAVVKLVLLYGSETWVLTPHMQRMWGGFHYRVARRLTGRQPWKGRHKGWVYLPLEDTMVEAGLQEVKTYVSCLQNTMAQYIVTRPIMDLCLAAERSSRQRLVTQNLGT